MPPATESMDPAVSLISPATLLMDVADPPIDVAVVLIVPAVPLIELARPSMDVASLLIERARDSIFVRTPSSGEAVLRIERAILLVSTSSAIASVDSLIVPPVELMLFALPSMLRAVLTVLASSPAAMVTDAATRTRMMRLTPCTPPLPPLGLPAVVVGPDVAVGRWDCGVADFLRFRVSVGTRRSARCGADAPVLLSTVAPLCFAPGRAWLGAPRTVSCSLPNSPGPGPGTSPSARPDRSAWPTLVHRALECPAVGGRSRGPCSLCRSAEGSFRKGL